MYPLSMVQPMKKKRGKADWHLDRFIGRISNHGKFSLVVLERNNRRESLDDACCPFSFPKQIYDLTLKVWGS